MIQDLMMRQAKIGQAIQLLREAGLADYMGETRGGTTQIAASASPVAQFTATGKRRRFQSAESRAQIGAKMRVRWAEKKAMGLNMNPNQKPKPFTIGGWVAGPSQLTSE